ncbi:MAG TPA: ATP phosphoribosyltransferase regulatory subunit, partial [Burkholderiales bacterium]|nr:ATP phosphoribosyltransferase regulatory subunit [Burkholderiales bacterium]
MRWLLPEHIEDILPGEAMRIEILRRRILDLFFKSRFELVIPPLVEFTDSLLTGTGHDLDLRTFKLVDQISGRMMGVRADITPQVARIDAHLLNRQGVTRLCYCGSVLHARPASPGATREPLQIGAEVYGHGGIESDREVQGLAVQALRASGIREPRIDLGHVAIFRALCRRGGVGAELETELHQALEAKDRPSLESATRRLPKATRAALLALPELYGGREVLARAARELPRHPEVAAALRDLRALTAGSDFQVGID